MIPPDSSAPSSAENWVQSRKGGGVIHSPFPCRNDSIGSVVLAASSSARASLLARYGPSIGPRLAHASSCERIRDATPFLPTESFRPAGTVRWDRSCWLRLLPQGLRCSLVTGLPSARASLSPRLAKESATPPLSSQLNRSGGDRFLGAWLRERSVFQRRGWHFGKHPAIVTR